MLRLRAFMFERVYLGPGARPEHERAHAVIRRIVDHLLERGDPVDDVVNYVAGMTDRFALTYARADSVVARIKDTSVEAVKQTASIVDVVSLRTPLRKVGGRYTGRCPFHEERTPSFSVNAEKGVYYCFGCGASGDTISFVRETEQLDFVGAVEFLAERFNVALEYDESSPQADADRKRRDRLYALLEQATSFYERYLWDSDAGAPAREYLAGRGLGEEACREFRLGLAPLAPALARKAQEKGFTPAELGAAGLVGRRGSDYFSGRLLFPLADARGRVVGFQARKLRDDDPLKAKYVNTPEGELFHKGAILYGLDRSRAAIASRTARSSSRATPT